MRGPKGQFDNITKNERRRYPRLPVQIPVFFKADSSNSHQSAFTRDISSKGLQLFARKADINSDDKINFVVPEIYGGNHSSIFYGRVIWTAKEKETLRSGISFENSMENVLSYLLLMAASNATFLNSSLFQSFLDCLSDASILLDSQLKIVAISSNQPLLSCDPHIMKGEKIGEAPTILKQLASEDFDPKKAVLKCLFSRQPVRFSALPLKLERNGDTENKYFNVHLQYLPVLKSQDLIFVQIKDVTILCQLKERIRERNNVFWDQYKFMTMEQIVDELLEDVISPLSAIVGRLDLLTMKMTGTQASGKKIFLDEWLRELHIIDGLVQQITELCSVAAKRRERKKIGSQKKMISFNKLIDETLLILQPKSSFRAVNIHLKFKKDLPEFKGDYFDWLNAQIALFQTIIRKMKTQSRKEISVVTYVENNYIVLSVSHNARALKIPLEREMGLGILEVLREKYGISIKTSGSNGCQKILFQVKIQKE